MSRILVTGASGCLGRGALEYLSERTSHELFGMVRRQPKNPVKGVKYVFADITRYDQLYKLLKENEIEQIWHFAAAVNNENKNLYIKINVEGTAHLLIAALKNNVRSFYYSSSTAVYGKIKYSPITEEYIPKPMGYYAKSKLEAEEMIKFACDNSDMFGGILRIPIVLGKGNRHFYHYARKLIRFNFFPIIGKRYHKLSLIHPYDVARAILILEENKDKVNNTEVYNVTSCDAEFEKLIRRIEEMAYGKSRWFKFRFPYFIFYFLAALYEGMYKTFNKKREPVFNREYAQMIGHSWVFSTKKISRLGYIPRVTLDEMIKDSETDYT